MPTRPQPSSPLLKARQRERDQASERLDLTGEQCHELTWFVAFLPRPEQVLPLDGTARAMVYAGEHLFEQVGCTDCHVKELATLDGVYSDFLLHDMGTELADRSPSLPEIIPGQKSSISGAAIPAVRSCVRRRRRRFPAIAWRSGGTPPLWGVADSAPVHARWPRRHAARCDPLPPGGGHAVTARFPGTLDRRAEPGAGVPGIAAGTRDSG